MTPGFITSRDKVARFRPGIPGLSEVTAESSLGFIGFSCLYICVMNILIIYYACVYIYIYISMRSVTYFMFDDGEVHLEVRMINSVLLFPWTYRFQAHG